MSLADFCVKRRTITYFGTLLALIAGIASYLGLGKLEDPEFTIKTAAVITQYPGATVEEVEQEVTEPIELSIQQLSQVDDIRSLSRPGISMIWIDIKTDYWSDRLPQVWDELRRKVTDATPSLPPGAGEPLVNDDFGDVFGFLFALTGDGYSYRELEDVAENIRDELSLLDGVAKSKIWGVQSRCIYLKADESRLASLGLTANDIFNTLQVQNQVVNAGNINFEEERIRIDITGAFSSVDEIGAVVVRGQNTGNQTDELIRIGDICEVVEGYVEPSTALMRYNGVPSLGLYVSNVSGANIIDLGLLIDAKLEEIYENLPVGLEMHKISWQSDEVSKSIKDFTISLIEAVLIVVAVLWIFMGFRTSMIISGCGLLFVILISFLCMKMWGIDLQRMSLGALVIAMGMMVDNAIVVADGILIRMQKGMDRVKAAVEAATQPSIPLLGATVIAVMAFYPIFASTADAGEYCRTLFQVVGISLMLSWLLSITVTPLMCIAFLPDVKGGDSDDVYGGGFYRKFRGVLHGAIRFRILFMAVLVAVLVVSGGLFRFVGQAFFPESTRKQFMVDYWAPEGTRIEETSAALKKIEAHLLEDEAITAVSTFVGGGPPRFYLPVEPEKSYSSYGQLIVNVTSYKEVLRLLGETEDWLVENMPEAICPVQKYGLGPSNTWKVEARFSGPAKSDPAVLRKLCDEAMAIMNASPYSKVVRSDWRQRVKQMTVEYDQEKGRWAGIDRQSVANATLRSNDGITTGIYREKDKLLPIILRQDDEGRELAVGAFKTLQVRGAGSTENVPLDQVTDSIEMEWTNPMIWRRNRRRAITAQAIPLGLASLLQADVKEKIEAIELPPNYSMEWGGDLDSSTEAKESLIPGIIPAFIIMALVNVGLFNAYKPPIIIGLVIPFALIGVVLGLIITGQPFGFMSLLGAMSLSGMMTKNCIVLLDQVAIEMEEGKTRYQAIVDSAISRLRPVVLAAATTILGVIPLMQDAFWVSMAVTIMFGLAIGTCLTLIVVPVLYSFLYKLPTKPDYEH